jgi:hypothetical protein
VLALGLGVGLGDATGTGTGEVRDLTVVVEPAGAVAGSDGVSVPAADVGDGEGVAAAAGLCTGPPTGRGGTGMRGDSTPGWPRIATAMKPR